MPKPLPHPSPDIPARFDTAAQVFLSRTHPAEELKEDLLTLATAGLALALIRAADSLDGLEGRLGAALQSLV